MTIINPNYLSVWSRDFCRYNNVVDVVDKLFFLLIKELNLCFRKLPLWIRWNHFLICHDVLWHIMINDVLSRKITMCHEMSSCHERSTCYLNWNIFPDVWWHEPDENFDDIWIYLIFHDIFFFFFSNHYIFRIVWSHISLGKFMYNIIMWSTFTFNIQCIKKNGWYAA